MTQTTCPYFHIETYETPDDIAPICKAIPNYTIMFPDCNNCPQYQNPQPDNWKQDLYESIEEYFSITEDFL